MNLKKILILLPLSIFNFILSAQVEDLMRDKNITWIAETYNDFQLEEAREKLSRQTFNTVTPLKFMDTQEGNFSEAIAFQEMFTEMLSNRKLPIFEDDYCKKRTMLGWRIDSITKIDPVTFKTTLVTAITKDNFRVHDFSFFRAHQIIFYNAKKAQFGMRTLAVAPMRKNWNYLPDSIMYLPAFWIKIQDLRKKRRLNDKNIAWAMRLKLSKGFLLIETKPKNGEVYTKILKIISEDMPVGHFLETVKTNPKIPFYQTFHSRDKSKYSLKDRQLVLTQVDTIQQINPDTYEMKLVITKAIKTVKDFPRLRLVQNWYWNSRKNRLEIYLVAAVPVEDMYEDNMELKQKYRREPVPILYRRNDD